MSGVGETLRAAAAENAHAFKAPLSVIAQSVETLRRGLPNVGSDGRRSLELVERSVERLDSLVLAARRMDELAAQSLEPSLAPLAKAPIINPSSTAKGLPSNTVRST